jgi:dinuclear metal center YbgI/SA1388 family protein
MKIKDIAACIEAFAPLAYQESYDNAGLICGNPEAGIESVLVTLDCTEAVVDEAIALKCRMIVAHHPIVFSGLKKFTGRSYVERVLMKAIKNDIALYAAHTNLDNVEKGVNAVMAAKLGLTNTRVLSPRSGVLRKLVTFCPVDKASEVRQALFAAGAGHIGNYDECSFNQEGFGTFRGNEVSNAYVGEKLKQHLEKELKVEVIYSADKEGQLLDALKKAHPYEEVAFDIYALENKHPLVGSGLVGDLPKEEDEAAFIGRLKKAFGAGTVKHTALLGKEVSRVALCGGSGSFLLGDAMASGAGVFVSSDFTYHRFFDADNKIVIADIGHYESEQFTGELICSIIREKFPIFAVHLSKINTNPVHYV